MQIAIWIFNALVVVLCIRQAIPIYRYLVRERKEDLRRTGEVKITRQGVEE